MARQESEREDLLREATALVERMEFRIPAFVEPIVFGFRRGGSASLYIGDKVVFQFNTSRQIRRAFWQGSLLKAEQGRLVALSRRRSENSVDLIRHPLSLAESAQLLAECQSWLHRIQQAMAANLIQELGQVSMDGSTINRMQFWLQAMPAQLVVAERPNVE
jgi:hypothetical protein